MTPSEAGKLGAQKMIENYLPKLKEHNSTHYLQNPKLCRFCSATIPYEKRYNDFCSQSCSAKLNNPLRSKKKEPKIKVSTKPKLPKYTLEQVKCQVCSETFDAKQGKIFCSQECFNKHKFETTINDAKSGLLISAIRLKRVLIHLDPACSICRNTEWNNQPIPLELDHIDGNSENNFLKNVRLLCPNCHAQTATYKAKNKGNGRHSRRKRYLEGKSF